MIVALTGASGFLGGAIARQLAQSGHQVTALVRDSSVTAHIEPFITRYVVGDQSDPATWAYFLKKADAVVHNSYDWAAIKAGGLRQHLESNLVGSLGLLNAVHEERINKFVYMSTVAVHHAMSDRWEGQIDEEHPLRPGGLYGACKAAIEAHLWAAHHSWGMHTVSLRPSAVYGVEPVRLARSWGYKMVRKLHDGGSVTPENFPGGGKWVHVDDVALATVRAIERQDASGRVFNLADCYAKFTTLAQFAAEAMGLEPDRVEVDSSPPAQNQFVKNACRDILGVPLDRGETGLRRYMADLVEAVRRAKAANT